MLGLSQWSFEYIEVALYTITKSTSIIFILFFAIIMGLERKVSVIRSTVLQIRISSYLYNFARSHSGSEIHISVLESIAFPLKSSIFTLYYNWLKGSVEQDEFGS
jgi:hypothetical protein